jgi:hypothetical protein
LAANDVPKSGKINEQVDPKFKGPIPDELPFADDEIKSGQQTEKVRAWLALLLQSRLPRYAGPRDALSERRADLI